MTHPHETKIKNIVRWKMLGHDEPSDDLDEFWEAVDSLPDVIDGKEYKKIIKKLFKKDGTPDFDSYEKLTLKLEKKGTKKDEEAFQEWHTMMGIIRRRVSHQIHMNRLRKDRNERKQEIKNRTRVDKLGAERGADNRESEYQAD